MQTIENKSHRRRPPRFDLIAGNVCLDFVNTLDDRHVEDQQVKPKELLASYDDLVRFAEDAGVLTPAQAERLVKRGSGAPERAQQALRRGRELREVIHDVFWPIINQRTVPPGALAKLNAEVQAAAEHLRLSPDNGGFAWRFDDLDDFEGLLRPIARSAADLLTSDQLSFVRACSSKDCEWVFLDTSKNHHRRWCDMSRCGNRAKVRSFYARARTGS